MHRRLKVGIGLFGFFTCCRSTLFMTQSPFVHFLVLLLHATRISGRPLPPLSFYAVHSNIKTHTNFGLSRHTIFSRINEDPFGLSFLLSFDRNLPLAPRDFNLISQRLSLLSPSLSLSLMPFSEWENFAV